MADLFASGRIVDLILLLVALEAALLIWRSKPPSAATALDVALALLPGVCLLIALRLALTGADWRAVATALAASFPLHLWDVWRRRLGRPKP